MGCKSPRAQPQTELVLGALILRKSQRQQAEDCLAGFCMSPSVGQEKSLFQSQEGMP